MKWETHDEQPPLHREERRVKVVARIRNNRTGEVREMKDWLFLDEGGDTPNTYTWVDGNYGCDCNRGIFFRRAGGEEGEWEVECSEGKFSVNLVNPETGGVFHREFES